MTEKGRLIVTLRKKGKTYGEIQKILNVPKSTVAWWLRNVKLSKSLQKKILERSRKKWRRSIVAYNKVHAKIRSQEAAKIRETHKKKAAKEIKKLSKKDLKLIGTALYWAEGNKKGRWALRFSNSDPLMIKTIMCFFRKVCRIPDEKIKGKIHLYPRIGHKKSINYWARITGLSKNNFLKPQIQISRASKRKRPRNTLPHGTLHLVAGNTEITSKVKGWIKGISEKF